MLPELEHHAHARAVLGPALAAQGQPSHAYLFHGPAGAGKRAAARAVAAELLTLGAADPDGSRARVASGAHSDLTWVVPGGAHEILVSDIDEPVVSAASRTPFEASRRVFVIERVDRLGDEAANRMLKTLEEPPSYVHLILITDRLGEVLPTISSRCQLVRFDPPPIEHVARTIAGEHVSAEGALACARLALGDVTRARELAGEDGAALRDAAEQYARAALSSEMGQRRPWEALMQAVRGRGEAVRAELEAQAAAELELYPRKDRKRIEGEWSERTRRVRRRVETATLDLELQLVELWFSDLACLVWGASDLVRHSDRIPTLEEDLGPAPQALRKAIELVEDTRQRFQLNVTEELACEALGYRLERALTA